MFSDRDKYYNIPITANDTGFMDLKQLYSGKDANFKIPDDQWLIQNNWATKQDFAFFIKTFEVYLPASNTFDHIVRIEAKTVEE